MFSRFLPAFPVPQGSDAPAGQGGEKGHERDAEAGVGFWSGAHDEEIDHDHEDQDQGWTTSVLQQQRDQSSA